MILRYLVPRERSEKETSSAKQAIHKMSAEMRDLLGMRT
jgi:hypothetical protein